MEGDIFQHSFKHLKPFFLFKLEWIYAELCSALFLMAQIHKNLIFLFWQKFWKVFPKVQMSVPLRGQRIIQQMLTVQSASKLIHGPRFGIILSNCYFQGFLLCITLSQNGREAIKVVLMELKQLQSLHVRSISMTMEQTICWWRLCDTYGRSGKTDFELGLFSQMNLYD